MPSPPGQILRLQIQYPQGSQILLAQASEIVQELFERFALTFFHLGEAVKGIKGPGFAVLQNDSHPGHPVSALPNDQVPDDIERAPAIFSFVVARPDVGQPAQQRIQACGSASQNRDGLGQIEFCQACHANLDAGPALWTQVKEGQRLSPGSAPKEYY